MSGTAARFYDALGVQDWTTMGRLYAPQARFRDPVFVDLDADRTRAMWHMLLSRARDFSCSATVEEDDRFARVIWVARYVFSATGRPVVNRVYTEMELGADRILRQVDRFNFWRWSRQAFGPLGWALGWTPMFRGKVRREAAANLAKFMQRN